MKVAIAHLKSSPGSVYQAGKPICTPRPDKTTPDQHEQNTWRERGHYDEKGRMYIPAISFKRALEDASAYNPRKLKGQTTFAKLFERSIVVSGMDNITLNATMNTVEGVALYVSANGEKSTKANVNVSKVWRTFPTVREWEGEITFHILDDRIDEAAFRDTLRDAGTYIGIGVWRPQKGGLNGRFGVVKLEWMEA